MDLQVIIVDQFATAMTLIQEAMTGLDKKMRTSLELVGRVFTCLCTLGSTSFMMIGLVRLLMYLRLYFHIDS